MLRFVILAALIASALVATDLRERAGRALYHAGAPGLAALLLDGAAWDAAALYHRGHHAEAAEAFRAQEFPGQLYDMGTALARAGRLKEASETLDAALARDPNDEDARFNLALVDALLKKPRADGPDAVNAANAAATQTKRSNTDRVEEQESVNSTGTGAAGDRDGGNRAENAGPSTVSRSGRADSPPSTEPKKASGSIGSAGGAGRTGEAKRNVARPPEQLAHRLPPMQLKTMAASQRWLETLPDDPGVYLRRRIEHERAGRRERGVAAPEMTDRW